MKSLWILVSVLVGLVGIAWLVPTGFWFALPSRVRRLFRPAHPFIDVKWELDGEKAGLGRSESPNIILIVADDLGINDLSGGAKVGTPNIDSIAANGVRFPIAYSGHTTCAPSRAALFTGRIPTKMGFEFTPAPKSILRVFSFMDAGGIRPSIYDHELAKTTPHQRSMVLPRNFSTIAEELASRHYRNYLIGKWHLGGVEPYRATDRGFHESISFPAGMSAYADEWDAKVVRAPLQGSGALFDELLGYLLPFQVNHNDGPSFPPNDYLTDYLTQKAVDLIESKATSSSPFFLSLTYSAPHSPLVAKREDYEDAEIAGIQNPTERVYAAMIKALDRGVGRVLQALQRTGKYDNTIVVFTSDNGAAQYLGLGTPNAPFRGWKGTFFEGGIRIPLMMQWPNQIPAGTTFSHPVSHMDLYASLVAAASGERARTSPVDGVNLLPWLVPEKREIPQEESTSTTTTTTSSPSPSITDRVLYWRSGHYQALRQGRWKIQSSQRPNRTWLFDLLVDPTERQDLAPQASQNATLAEHLRRMQELLVQVQAEQVPPLWPSVLEVAMFPDRLSTESVGHEDDYVYWAN